MLRDRGDMRSLELPGRRSPRRLGRVVLVILSWLLTVAAAGVGLRIAWRLWTDYVKAKDCPAPEVVVAPPPAPAFNVPPTYVTIKLMSVRDEAVEINVNGDRFDLPGYPPPSSPDHEQGRLTTAVASVEGEQVAIAGICPGNPGTRRPSCARKFVRIYQAADGAHVRDLKMPWADDDERRVLAMSYDGSGDRLAVLVRTAWSDCMWEGARIELFVYWVPDGTQVLHRVLDKDDKGGKRQLTVVGDEIRVFTTRPHRKMNVRIVPLPRPDFIEDCD